MGEEERAGLSAEVVPKLASGGWGPGGIIHWKCAKALR